MGGVLGCDASRAHVRMSSPSSVVSVRVMGTTGSRVALGVWRALCSPTAGRPRAMVSPFARSTVAAMPARHGAWEGGRGRRTARYSLVRHVVGSRGHFYCG